MLKTLRDLHDLGFDRSTRRGKHYWIECSQCEAAVINNVPTHERGCPNARHECRTCNNLAPRGQQYCEDCY